MHCIAHVNQRAIVRQLERAYDIPSRVQFTPLLYGIDGSADFYFEKRDLKGVVKISKSGEVIQYSSTMAGIKSLVEQEFQKTLRECKFPRASL